MDAGSLVPLKIRDMMKCKIFAILRQAQPMKCQPATLPSQKRQHPKGIGLNQRMQKYRYVSRRVFPNNPCITLVKYMLVYPRALFALSGKVGPKTLNSLPGPSDSNSSTGKSWADIAAGKARRRADVKKTRRIKGHLYPQPPPHKDPNVFT